MPVLSVSYPCDPVTLAPKRLRASRITAVAAAVRAQLKLAPSRLDLELLQLVSRATSLVVNGVPFTICWNLGQTVKDPAGLPAYGACEVIGEGTLLISLNVQIVGDAAIARSTALHELGHAVFDAPGWLNGTQDHFEHVPRRMLGAQHDRAPDWSEWRANEFMGSFLAPRELLHRELLKLAPLCGVPLVRGRFSNEPPVAAHCPELPLLADALGEAFGLTASFIAVRLAKYDLVAPLGTESA